MKGSRPITACAAFAVSLLIACQGSINRVSRPQMGTIVTVTFIGDPATAGGVSAAVFREIDRIEGVMSARRAGSDIARVNSKASREAVKVSDETAAILLRSEQISEETDGAFDVTFAALEPLWDFRAPSFTPPPSSRVKALLPLVNYRNMRIEKNSISFARPGMRIGLGAIAKGYAVERGIAVLKRCGVRDAIVEAGGDLQAIGDRHGRRWTAGLRHPRKQSILLTIELEHGDAVATSGDYERCVVRGNTRYHHIIDPRTGFPTQTFSSVTVVSKNPVLSDAYATAIFVMGMDKARLFLERHAEIGVVLVDLKMNLFISKRLKERVVLLEDMPIHWW